MTAPQARRARAEARWLGYALLTLTWLALSAASLGAEIQIEGWMVTVATVVGGGLILWGSMKTRVERLEEDRKADRAEIEKRLSREVFTQFYDDLVDRLERIEKKQDQK